MRKYPPPQLFLLLFLFLFQFSAHVFAQTTRTITGVVKDSANNPLVAATVSVKGHKISTTTAADGSFSIAIPSGEVALEVNYIGYNPVSLSINPTQTDVSVTLTQGLNTISDVVVTALGIQKQKKALGYSTTEVDGSKFTQSREPNLGNALTGQVAGVSVAGLATGPSGSSRITIRGNSSLGGNNQPLYVIDGIPFDNTNQGSSGQWGGADFGDGLSTINPDDIASIQVLKGVAGSALYGYRGGNGAILITTKSGAKSKGVGVEVNDNFTVNNVIDLRDYQYEYGQGTQGVKPTTQDAALGVPQSSWGAKLDGSDAINFLGNTYAYSPAKNNFENFFRTGLTNQASVAVAGSSDKVTYRLGISDMYMKTVIPNSGMRQQGVNLNTTYHVTSKLQATATINYVFEQVNNRASFSDAPGNVIAGPLYLANSFDIRWLEPKTKADGSELLPGTDIYFNNPYFVAYNYENETRRNRFTGGLTLKYNFTDWLSLQGQVTRDGYIFDLKNITPTGTGYQPGGSITQTSTNYHETNANWLLDFNKKFSDFTVHANVGGNMQDDIVSTSGVYGAGPFNVPYFYDINNVTSRPMSYSYSHYRVNSLYAAADIGYKNYLFLSATARNDWFSTLNTETNSYLYPSVSSSFVFSDAFKLPEFISFGKLRASYAYSSNGTTPYQNLLTYGLQGYALGDQPLGYINQTDIPNAFLKPVKISEQEIGLNMDFFHSRVGFDVAFYNKKTTDDILGVTISSTTGYTGNVVNIGEIRNKGLELLLHGTPVKTRNFSWNSSFNIAFNNNEVLQLAPPDNTPIVIDGAFPRWGDGVSLKNIVGLPYSQIVGYAYKKDANGNKIFGADGMPERTDLIPLGSGVYKTTGGFSNDLQYKSFTLSFLFDFKYGAKIFSQTNLLLYNNGQQKTTLDGRDGGVVGKGVTEDGKPNTTSVNSEIYYTNLATGSDHITEEFVYDASFIKLRSLSLAYSLPQSILGKGFIKGVSLSVVGRNLAILMKHTPNIDPESGLNSTNGQGMELSGYPPQRNIGFNVNVKF